MQDSGESEFAPEAILNRPHDLALDAVGNSPISEADATSASKVQSQLADAAVHAPETVALKDLSILIAEDKALDGCLIPETSSHEPSTNTKDHEPATSAPLPNPKCLAIEPAENVFTPEYVEQEITTRGDIPETAADNGDSSADSCEGEFALEAILTDRGNRALGAVDSSYISEADAASSTDFLHRGEVGTLDSSPYLRARMIAAGNGRFLGRN